MDRPKESDQKLKLQRNDHDDRSQSDNQLESLFSFATIITSSSTAFPSSLTSTASIYGKGFAFAVPNSSGFNFMSSGIL